MQANDTMLHLWSLGRVKAKVREIYYRFDT